MSEHQLTLPHIYSQNLHRNFKQSHLPRWLAALRASGIGRDHAAGVFKVHLLQLVGIDVDGWQAALETVQEQVRQCQAHDGMLSQRYASRQSAASLSAELAQTTKALARLQGAYQEEQITVATLRSSNADMEQSLADRAFETKALGEQLAQARVQFEHFQETIATQRLDGRRAFDRHAGRLEHDLASAQQQLGQLRHELPARVDDAGAAREELATVLAKRAQLTRRLAEAEERKR
ncbi:hypothetical protein [Janthinobacterium lividum]|nr:hypothetical protein [Janthinobacterium lividum]